MNGVYIIWHGGTSPATVYVGQGIIRDRLTQHRTDPRIQAYLSLGLYVTWYPCRKPSAMGLLKYSMLHNGFSRKLESGIQPHLPIEVNLPW